VLLPALALEILAGVVVMGWASLAGLLVARILSGRGIGVVTATAMAWLTELHDPAAGSRQTQVIACTRVSLLVFAGLLAPGIMTAAPTLLGPDAHHHPPQPQPTPA
jgi:MFS family permease